MSATDGRFPRVTRDAGRVSDLAVFVCVLLFFLVSGACALLYEVVWTRKLVLLFGTTAYAVSTVLAVYFAGMGLGSLLGGRLADWTRRPLVLYGVFELAIGGYAALFLFLLRGGESVLVGLISALSVSRGAGIGLRGALSLLLLILPVSLMGATLPLLSRAVVSEQKTLGLRIGSLYTVNTLGAVCGCFLAGFVLLPRFGFSGATLIGVGASLAVGCSAVVLALIGAGKTPGHGAAPLHDPEPASDAVGVQYSNRVAGLVMVALGVSGFCALALEVLWFRTLTIVFLGTTYAFTTMLTTFLCGLAAGSMYASSKVDRRRHLVSMLGMVEVLIAAACIFMLTVYTWLPPILDFLRRQYDYDWTRLAAIKFALGFAVLFVPTFLFGMTFPIAVKIVAAGRAGSGRTGLGGRVGRLYGANTFGGVAGSLVAGFILIPLLGTHRGIELVAAIVFGLGILLILVCPTRRIGGKGVLAVMAALVLALSLQTKPADMARTLNRSFLPADEGMLFYREGIEGTVVISEPIGNRSGSDRTLWINASPATATIDKGVKMSRLEGLLPILFDRHPANALLMCYGTGVTAGMLAQFDLDRVDAVEISRDVAESSHYFGADNFNVAEDPKLNMIVDDGRNFLLTTRNRYDVITFEPMPLALAGVSAFYTREYYQLCRDHLAPGGIVSQWIPLHSLNPGIVRSLVRTFYEAFPECTMWFINSDIFMIGSDQPLAIDYARLARRIAPQPIGDALAQAGLGGIEELLVCFFMGKGNVEAYSHGASIMTDDRPWAEFEAPKEVYTNTVDASLRQMMPFYENPSVILRFPGMTGEQVRGTTARIDRRHRAHALDLEGEIAYYGGASGFGDPDAAFKEALAIDPDDLTAPFYIKEIAVAQAGYWLSAGRVAKAITILSEAIRYAPNEAALYAELAGIYHRQLEQNDKALEYCEAYLKAGGRSARIAELADTLRAAQKEASAPQAR